MQTKKQSSTVKSYISAIKAVLKSNNIRMHENQYLLTAMTRACHLKNDRIKTRMTIQKGMLSVLLRTTNSHFMEINQPFLAILYQALFSTAYFGLFRVSELVTGEHPVLAKDVHIGQNKKKMLFVLHSSKTHTRNVPPQIVKISSSSNRSDKSSKPK